MRTRALSVLLVSALLLVSGVSAGTAGAELATDRTTIDETPTIESAVTATEPLQTDGAVRGHPDIQTFVPDPNLIPGRNNEVQIQIANDGMLGFGDAAGQSIVTTARNVRVKADGDGTPLSVESGETAIGAVTTEAPRGVSMSVDVPDNIEAGTYTIDLEITYSYRSFQGESPVGSNANERTRTVSREVDLRVRDDARFEIVDTESDVQVGDSGTLEATIENVGSETAYNADVGFGTQSRSVSVSGGESDTVRVEELAPGETTTVAYDVGVGENLPVQQYTLSGSVRFEDSDGITRTDEGLSIGVLPLAEQTFAVSDVESDLRVGEDGDVYGTVRNDGPVPANNVVVRYAGDSASVLPIEDSTAVGTLDAGESTDFSLPISVGGEAEPGLRSLDLAVQYRNGEGEVRMDEDHAADVEVTPKRDRFDVEPTNRSIEAGITRSVDVKVTNNLDETVTDVEARMFANDPLDTGDTDTGYVQSLDPGETTTMTFELTTTASATPGSTYPISLDFRYDDADGDSQLSDTYRVPIDIIESEDDGLPLPIIFVALLIIGTGGLVLYRRRQ